MSGSGNNAPCSLDAAPCNSSIFSSSPSPRFTASLPIATVLNASLLSSITTMTYSSSINTHSSSVISMPPNVYITSASSTNVDVNTNPNSDSSVIIAGAAAGGVVLVVALVACIMFCCSRK